MNRQLLTLATILIIAASACRPSDRDRSGGENEPATKTYPTTGEILRISPALDTILHADAALEILATGFDWSEGPVWIPSHSLLLFSDVPTNRIYSWREGDTTAAVFLEPSGYTGQTPRGGEPGSNGLTLDSGGRLVLCQHGDRRMARLDAPFDRPEPNFTTLADVYDGKRFNSPNDAVYDSRGNLYFTDPPYGLEGNVNDPAKELPYQGIYEVTPEGEVRLLDTLSRPNGIALSPDETKLYVANSDPQRAVWMVYDLDPDAGTSNGRVFLDAGTRRNEGPGLPDGLKVDRRGLIFATGPGGVWVISPQAELLGIIKTGQATANCAFNEAQDMLFIAADSLLLRVRLR
jgi:gluconolactonase